MKQTTFFRRFYLLTIMLIAMTMGAKAEPVAYATLSSDNATMTFKYGEMPTGGYVWNVTSTGESVSWSMNAENITKVVFDESFADARPHNCTYWFNDMENLEEIVGLAFLNTSEVTNMAYMFAFCSKLTSLDLGNFDTSKVTDMNAMFFGCSSLKTADVSKFNTSNVTDMTEMFNGCSSLRKIDVSNFDMSKVTEKEDMLPE